MFSPYFMNISYSLLFNDLIAFTSYQANKQKDFGDIAPHCFAKPGVGASGIGAPKNGLRPVRYVPWVCGH
jgi:hypothetical protein